MCVCVCVCECVCVCVCVHKYILIEIRDFRGSYSFIFNNSTGKQFCFPVELLKINE